MHPMHSSVQSERVVQCVLEITMFRFLIDECVCAHPLPVPKTNAKYLVGTYVTLLLWMFLIVHAAEGDASKTKDAGHKEACDWFVCEKQCERMFDQ